MLSIFSCAYWLSVCLLWRNGYLGLLPISFSFFLPISWLGFVVVVVVVVVVIECMKCLYMCESVCLTLCDTMDCSPAGSSVHGISLARIPQWMPFRSAEDLPHPGTKPASPALAGQFFSAEPPGKPHISTRHLQFLCCKNMVLIFIWKICFKGGILTIQKERLRFILYR